MNYGQWRHSARAWLFHFFGKEDLAYDEYVVAFRHAPSAPAARSIAFIAATRENFAEAVSWFEKAVALEPQDNDTWFNLGFVRDRAGQREAAITAFDEAIRLNPAHDRAWYGLGLAHAHLGQHAEAAAAFEKAAKLQPMNGDAWYHVGMAQHLANNPDRVTRVIEHLRSFDPKRSNRLIRETERSDLAHLIREELPYSK
ncbi:MAG: tetratricopeptide repeat protein [Betaproteobacteria bacterium]|nr:tetratricopeptide repeat protein [Betaproteobacteria bacterium]